MYSDEVMIRKSIKRILVVEAGISGAFPAREQAESLNENATVTDERGHINGNFHTSRDPSTSIMAHAYGPHIFNTDRHDIRAYVNRFGDMVAYTNRVKAVTRLRVFSLPINRQTSNQFF